MSESCRVQKLFLTHSFLSYFQSHYAQQARRSRSITLKRKRETSAPPTSKTRSQSASRPPRDKSGLRDPKVRDIVFKWLNSAAVLFTCKATSYFVLKYSSLSCSLDGKEGKEDDEELPERHEPPWQEGRGGPTCVRPQTQTPPGRQEEVWHQRSKIKLISFSFSGLLRPGHSFMKERFLCGDIIVFVSTAYTKNKEAREEHEIFLNEQSGPVILWHERQPWGWWSPRKLSSFFIIWKSRVKKTDV